MVKPRPFSPTVGNPATLRSQQRNPSHDQLRNQSCRFTRFPPKTLRTALSVSYPPLHLLWSKATPLSQLNSMNAHQAKWKSRTTWPSFLFASHATNRPQRLSSHPLMWCQQKTKLLIGWSKAMLAWCGGGHMPKICTVQTVTLHSWRSPTVSIRSLFMLANTALIATMC